MSKHDKKELTFDNVRDEVKNFAIAMEQALRDNEWRGYLEDKNGWESMSRQKLFYELSYEAVNLSVAVQSRSKPRIISKSIDVGNYAMMLFDNESRPKKDLKKEDE
jgi:hypothetical protein